MIDDIEDNYVEYLDDESGYAWDAWDVLSADIIRRHDAIAAASAEELSELDPAGLADLDRWAYARASRAAGDSDGFLEAARLLLASPEEHRGLQYAEVYIAAIEAMVTEGLGDEARLHLGAFQERWPEDTRSDRLAVLVAAPAERASAVTAALASEDADRLFEIAEDLGESDITSVRALLDRAEAVARQQGYVSMLLDIDLLRGSLGVTE